MLLMEGTAYSFMLVPGSALSGVPAVSLNACLWTRQSFGERYLAEQHGRVWVRRIRCAADDMHTGRVEVARLARVFRVSREADTHTAYSRDSAKQRAMRIAWQLHVLLVPVAPQKSKHTCGQ